MGLKTQLLILHSTTGLSTSPQFLMTKEWLGLKILVRILSLMAIQFTMLKRVLLPDLPRSFLPRLIRTSLDNGSFKMVISNTIPLSLRNFLSKLLEKSHNLFKFVDFSNR